MRIVSLCHFRMVNIGRRQLVKPPRRLTNQAFRTAKARNLWLSNRIRDPDSRYSGFRRGVPRNCLFLLDFVGRFHCQVLRVSVAVAPAYSGALSARRSLRKQSLQRPVMLRPDPVFA